MLRKNWNRKLRMSKQSEWHSNRNIKERRKMLLLRRVILEMSPQRSVNTTTRYFDRGQSQKRNYDTRYIVGIAFGWPKINCVLFACRWKAEFLMRNWNFIRRYVDHFDISIIFRHLTGIFSLISAFKKVLIFFGKKRKKKKRKKKCSENDLIYRSQVVKFSKPIVAASYQIIFYELAQRSLPLRK